jgi:Lipid A 3-O-deacylase (PagL)
LVRINVCHTGAQERLRPFRAATVTLCVVAGILALLLSRNTEAQEKRTPESDLALTGIGSFGHFHIFANSWWSYLDIAGVEYDRNSWGYAAKARMDYSAEVQPMVLLWQPSKQSLWGTPGSKQHEFVYGIGVMPIGLRMLWRDGKKFEPYLMAKGGMLLFDKKALSSQAAYGDFSLLMGTGTQFRLSRRVDGRVGFTFFHFSDAFMVPSNPGLDSMTYSTGLVYHLGGER